MQSKLQRGKLQVFSSFEEAEQDQRVYWFSKTPEERFLAVEQLRQMWYGYDPTTARLQRVFEIARQA